jgi:hypothetical protein
MQHLRLAAGPRARVWRSGVDLFDYHNSYSFRCHLLYSCPGSPKTQNASDVGKAM